MKQASVLESMRKANAGAAYRIRNALKDNTASRFCTPVLAGGFVQQAREIRKELANKQTTC